MKKFFVTGFVALLVLCNKINAQSYQLSGNPVNTTGWSLVPSATVNTDFIQLTADQISQVGGIKLDDPINLKYCDKWKVEFDFRIDGNGTTSYGRGDGFAFWYLANPPASYVQGGGLGIPGNASGLMVAFDIFNNSSEGQMSKVHVLYGTNNLPAGNNNIEYNNTAGSTFHTPDLISTIPFVGSTYRHVEVNGEIDPNNIANWIITIKIDNNTIVNQSFAPSGGAATMTQGYFGFSASTGAASARHSIKNVKVYVDKVPLLQETVTPSETCPNALTGVVTTDLTSFNTQFVSNPANYTFTYVVNGTPVTNPSSYQFSANTTVNVIVKDNSGTFCDNPDAKIILTPKDVEKTDATLFGCPVSGLSVFNLTQANVTTLTNVTKQYYRTLADLNAGANEITNPATFSSAEDEVYVKINTSTGCMAIAKITLKLYPVPVVNDTTIRTCFNTNNVSTGTFNLTVAAVTTATGITKKYFTNYNDALAEINEIPNPLAYISANGFAYIKVINSNGCGSIAKVTLDVIPPVYSTLLKDQIICIENTTTLDAGSGFSAYAWSTGATTQSINVGVGNYWVDLKTGDCVLRQEVKVIPSESPVIKEIHQEGNIATVEVKGGKTPYQYSLDGILWQESNVFSHLIRGENTFYVKDFYNCEPVVVTVTVPNLVNVITPNGDGYNDTINYSELGYKKNLSFIIYDRYGNKIFEGNSFNNYTWDGTIQGRKVPTQTYWYHISWDEPSKDRPQIKLTGWILMKNRD